jgi:O-antigen ligase
LRPISAGRLGAGLLLAVPALLTVYFSFAGGGFFAGSTGVAAVFVWIALAVRMVAADRPVAGLSAPLAVAAGALALFAVWVLVSTAWSDSAARGLIEFDRALLYLGLLLLFGSLPRTAGQIEWALRGLLLALLTVGVFALLSRVLPDVVTTRHDIVADRLSYPLTYWNGLGLFLGLGVILALHFASSEREPGWMRVLGAGAAPVLAAGLYFTLSRGAIVATVAGAVGYLLLARPRGALAGLLAVVPACTLAVVAGYHADLLSTIDPTSAAAIAQGKDAALVIGLSVVLALVVRAAGLLLDRRLARVRVTARARRAGWVGGAVAALVALAVCWVAFDLGDRVQRQYDGFVSGTTVKTGGDIRQRLTSPGNNGRLDHWRVALDAFEKEPLHGTGAGTYGITWARDRPIDLKVEDAHSLYVELLSELGLPGLLLVLAAILTVLFGFARGVGGPDRHLYAALFAAGGAWALHAGIDWDWELPAVTSWFWAFGGMALAAPAVSARQAVPANLMRVVVAIGCLALAVTPALMAVSQARLNTAISAFKQGDCDSAIDAALGSLKAIPSRPQPFEVLGYCDATLGQDRLALGAMQGGLDRDPDNWELHYGLALVRADAGLDPRPAARRALSLNPRGELPRSAVRRFATSDPRKWKRRAQRARLPIR